MSTSTVYSCVIERPLHCYQVMIWASTLVELAGVDPRCIVVHVLDSVPQGTIDALRRLGLRVERAAGFDGRHAHSNKLAQLNSPVLHDSEHVVLSDADIAFAGSIQRWVGGDKLRGKVVDYARPDLAAWHGLLSALGMQEGGVAVPLASRATHNDKPTYANNLNGGLLIIPQVSFQKLREEWPKWNRALLDRPELMGEHSFHADQISLGLALAALGETADHLPLALNLPTNLIVPPSSLDEEPRVLHFHEHLSPLGRLLPTRNRNSLADAAITRVNAVIERRALKPDMTQRKALAQAAAKRLKRRVMWNR